MYRDQYCDRCERDKDNDCPIWTMHLMYNEGNNKKSLLHKMIPLSKDGLSNEQCKYFKPYENGENKPFRPGQLKTLQEIKNEKEASKESE